MRLTPVLLSKPKTMWAALQVKTNDQENVPAQKAATPVIRHADHSRALVPPSVLRVVHQPRWFRKESAGAGTESGSRNFGRQSVSEERVTVHDDLPQREAFGTAPGPTRPKAHAARTHDSKAAQVKNEGAFPYVDV